MILRDAVTATTPRKCSTTASFGSFGPQSCGKPRSQPRFGDMQDEKQVAHVESPDGIIAWCTKCFRAATAPTLEVAAQRLEEFEAASTKSQALVRR